MAGNSESRPERSGRPSDDVLWRERSEDTIAPPLPQAVEYVGPHGLCRDGICLQIARAIRFLKGGSRPRYFLVPPHEIPGAEGSPAAFVLGGAA